MISSTFKNAALAATALLALSANAHMVMKTPIPYGKSTLNNSPLDASGSDFPCKLRSGAFDLEGAENIMAIGEPQTLSFTGSAVHGGGSCQVALTTDLQPTKQSKWMVIKSIEGGCPANVPGNLPADPNGSGASTFQYTVPEGIAPGQYTIAWSWMNKVGNREYYMNCGPATVVGAKKRRYAPAPKEAPLASTVLLLNQGSQASPASTATLQNQSFQTSPTASITASPNSIAKRQTTFPDLFVCNLASVNDCKTPENFDYEFPDPGQDVQKAGVGPYTLLAGGAGAGGAPQQPQQPSTAPTATGAAPSTLLTATGSQPPSTSNGPQFAGPSGMPSGQPSYGNPGSTEKPQQTGGPGNFASGASSATVQVIPVSPTTFSTVPIPTSSATGTGNNSSSGSSTSNSPSGGEPEGACTAEGEWYCSPDGRSFKRCSSGQWSTLMAMSAGMTCTPGTSNDLAMAPGRHKRHVHGFLHSFH